MNYKQCVIFREIAKTQNFTKAANQLYMTQSAISHAVKDLEEEAGTQLFERLHRSVKLTPAGALFLREIQPIIEAFESVEARLPNLEKQPPLTIASCITYAQIALPQLLHCFTKTHPDVHFKVQIFPASESITRLESGEVDLAFIEGHVLQSSFQAKKIAEYRLCVVAAPAAEVTEVSFAELLQQPLLLRERGSAVRETFESAAVLKGYKLFPIWESIDSQALLSAVKGGFGLSVLPYPLVQEAIQQGKVKEVKVKDWRSINDISVVMRKSRYHSQVLSEFWQALDAVDELPLNV
ncbi:MAG: LysR family transcriptional regulator [Enterococcus gilvus]